MSSLVLEETAPAAPDRGEMPPPYPGLRPFVEGESHLFFGREREIGTILTLLELQQLVVVHGASGCGKSSVVRAGVIPVFRLDALANAADARVIIIRPADPGGPLQALARKLEREFPLSEPPTAARDGVAVGGAPGQAPGSWSEILTASSDWNRDIGEAARAAGATLCILIDQFEEIFVANRAGYAAEVARLIEFLISLGEEARAGTALGERPLSVILTMRSDYLGQCALWDGFAEAVNRCQYLLPKISTVGLLRAIHEPARRNGAVVEEAVADRLLPVISREVDGLPILQHALMRSWQIAAEHEGRRVIDLEALEKVGGAEHALSQHAESAFDKATDQGNPLRVETANWIFRALSDLDSDGRIIRRSITLRDLVRETGADEAMVQSILDVFRDPEFSLVMPYLSESLDENSVISVSHEALLRQWQRITDSGFDENAQPIGLAYREFQDGMIWRALSVQAQVFAHDRSSVLGPAATEQRLPWYREIERRPGWIRRYMLQGVPGAREEEQAKWLEVAEFMKASKANLEREYNKLKAEQELVHRLRRNQKLLLALAAAVVLLIALVAALALYINNQRAKADVEEAAKRTEEGATTKAQLQLANEMARRECVGNHKTGAPCSPSVTAKYLKLIQNNPLDPVEKAFSPVSGGIGKFHPQQRPLQPEKSK